MATGKTTTALNLRSGPDESHPVLEILPAFTPLTIVETVGVWLKVEINGRSGYVHGSYVQQETSDEIDNVFSDEIDGRIGHTTNILNFRTGPSVSHDVIKRLPFNTAVLILEDLGAWFHVRVDGQEGFVHSGFIHIEAEDLAPGFIDRSGDPAAPDLADTPHAPAPAEQIWLSADMSGADRFVANTWNSFGGLFTALASRLGFDPGVAVAVFVAESGGSGFINGRMVIRFENHIFHQKWGKFNQSRFDQHFRFDPSTIWTNHQWRPDINSDWRNFHGNQDAEWEAFTFARTLDDTAAKLSISMGGPQIMGFNHHAVGFESVHLMFDAFAESEANQIVGFFDFVKGPGTDVRRVTALKRFDFETFASLYNGPGQASRYASIIQALYNTYVRLRTTQ